MYTNCSCVATSIMYKMNLTMQDQVTMTTPVASDTTTASMPTNETGPPRGLFHTFFFSILVKVESSRASKPKGKKCKRTLQYLVSIIYIISSSIS